LEHNIKFFSENVQISRWVYKDRFIVVSQKK
jgi:hypothetical protein